MLAKLKQAIRENQKANSDLLTVLGVQRTPANDHKPVQVAGIIAIITAIFHRALL